MILLRTRIGVRGLPNLLTIYSLHYRLVKNIVCVTSCYDLEMLAEHTASGSLFESISLQQNPSPPPPPPPPDNFELQEILIISYSLVYNNIWFIKDIDITLMSLFIKY